MSRPIIVVGDRTSHGGVVISGSPFTDIEGKAVARIGDKVTCPQKGHGGVTVIVTGDITNNIDGNPVARHGDKTACGATLFSSQILSYVDDQSSSGSGGAGVVTSPLTSVPAKTTPDVFNDIYQLVDERTGDPLAKCEYAIKRADGKIVFGVTDSSGYTSKIGDADSAELLSFDLGDWEA